jgi:hypothetical protein
MISQVRVTESDTDSKRYGESEFDYWEQVVNDKSNMTTTTEILLRQLMTFQFRLFTI